MSGPRGRALTLRSIIDDGWALVRETPGYLTEREARFLMTAMALAPASGANVEIGSFKGRSTVGLAYVGSKLGLGSVTAIDPHSCPSPTDPRLVDKTSTYDDFLRNLTRAGVRNGVAPIQAFSGETAKTWRAPIRFLWIDGDHSYEGARADVRDFVPFLVPGAVLAMHDVLGTWAGTLRVFDEEILHARDFGPAGFCGSIAWAQYRPRDGASPRRRLQHTALSVPVRQLIPIADRGKVEFGEEKLIRLRGADKWRYKFWRAMVPHGWVNAERLRRRLGA